MRLLLLLLQRLRCVVGNYSVMLLTAGQSSSQVTPQDNRRTIPWLQGASHIYPNHSTLFVFIFERLFKPLSIFQHPSMRFLGGYHGPAGHAMVFVMLFKRLGRNGEAIHQTRTTHQLASSLTLSQVNLAAVAGRTSADLPRFPPSQN